MSLLDKSIVLLAKYADVIRCAAPRLALWRGVSSFLNGKRKDSDKQLKEAFQLALDMSMLYEQALALMYRGVLGSGKGGEALRAQADDILKSMSIQWTKEPPFVDAAKLLAGVSKK